MQVLLNDEGSRLHSVESVDQVVTECTFSLLPVLLYSGGPNIYIARIEFSLHGSSS